MGGGMSHAAFRSTAPAQRPSSGSSRGMQHARLVGAGFGQRNLSTSPALGERMSDTLGSKPPSQQVFVKEDTDGSNDLLCAGRRSAVSGLSHGGSDRVASPPRGGSREFPKVDTAQEGTSTALRQSNEEATSGSPESPGSRRRNELWRTSPPARSEAVSPDGHRHSRLSSRYPSTASARRPSPLEEGTVIDELVLKDAEGADDIGWKKQGEGDPETGAGDGGMPKPSVLEDKTSKMIAKRFRFTKDALVERNTVMFSPPVTELPGRSLGYFDEWDPNRIICADLLRMPAMQLFFYTVMLANVCLIAVKPSNPTLGFVDEYGEPRAYADASNYYFVVEILAIVVLFFEMCLAVVARGLFRGPYAFVRDPFNILDVMVFLASVSEVCMTSIGWTVNIRAFRLLRLVKPGMMLQTCHGLRESIVGMLMSLPKYLVCVMLAFVFALSFSLAMIPPFSGKLVGRCVLPGRDTVTMLERFDDFSRVSPMTPETFCQKDENTASGLLSQSTCPSGFVCDTNYGNPGGGYLSYDGQFSALVAIFASSFGDGVSLYQRRVAEAYPEMGEFGYFAIMVAALLFTVLVQRVSVAVTAAALVRLPLGPHN